MQSYDPYTPPRNDLPSAAPAGYKRAIMGQIAIVAIGVGVAAQTLEALTLLVRRR